VIAARWNEAHVQRLVDAALDTLRRQGARDEDVVLTWVPGSFELPVAARGPPTRAASTPCSRSAW
jgi:6,7-dimethyl-8-ribityllumazine synthase